MAMASPSISTHPPRTPVDADVDMDDPETENDNDEEIDQLDSDTTEDEDVPTSGTPSSPNKARLKKAGERVPGHSTIPMTRIEDTMNAEGLAGSMSKEAVFLVAVATEEFVKRLTLAGQRQANYEHRSMVNYHDVASAVQGNTAWSFLEETIPMPVSVGEALERRSAKEKELLEPEAAVVTAVPSPLIKSTTVTPPPPASSSSASGPRMVKTTKAKGKARGHHEPEMGTFSPASTPITVPPPSTSSPRSQRTKGKVRPAANQTNGHAHSNIASPTTPDTNTNNLSMDAQPNSAAAKATPKNTSASTSATAGDTVSITSNPSSSVTTRRQSLRQHKPRRRPDDEDEIPAKDLTSRSALAAKSSIEAPRAKRARRASARSNGAVHSVNGSTEGTLKDEVPSTPAPHLPPEYVDAHADSSEEQWPSGKFTGPASGYIEGRTKSEERRLLFGGKNGMPDNPGRTIYTQPRHHKR